MNVKIRVSKICGQAHKLSCGVADFNEFVTFIIYDEQDNQIYRKEKAIVVETENVLFENFEDLEIEPGKYLFVLRTIYDVDVEDYFEQYFEYLEKQNYWFLIIIVVVVILGLFFGLKDRVFGAKDKGED